MHNAITLCKPLSHLGDTRQGSVHANGIIFNKRMQLYKKSCNFFRGKKPLNNILQTYLPIQKHLFIFKILQMANNFPLYGRAGN